MSIDTVPQTCPVQHLHPAPPVTAPRSLPTGKSGTRRRPPGPKGLDALRFPLALAKDPFGVWAGLARKYGDVVDLPIPKVTVTLLSHPHHIEHILVRHPDRYVKHELTHELVAGQAPALPLNEGEEWRRVRRAVNPRLTGNALAAICPTVAATAVEYIDGWQEWADTGEYIDLNHQVGVAAMAALMRTLFDIPISRETIDAAVHDIDAYSNYVIKRVLLKWLPGVVGDAVLDSGPQERVFGLAGGLIDYRRANPTDDPDMVSLLLNARYADGTGLTEDRLRSEVLGLVFAGFDTTALACSWTIGLLALHPQAQQRVYDEVDALGDKVVEHDDLDRLPFLRRCFDEAQRLQAVPVWPRQVTEDDELGGFHLPAGSTVLFSPYGLQRDPRFWREPDRFDPDRFVTDPINRYAFLPFNAGPRKCAGSKMAYVEGLTILATAYQRYRFRTRPGWRPINKPQVATGLKGGLPVTIHRRTR